MRGFKMRFGKIVSSVILISALMVAVSPSVGESNNIGVPYRYEALIDIDSNPSTGGKVSVVQKDETAHDVVGIDYIVRAVVNSGEFNNVSGLRRVSVSNDPRVTSLEVLSSVSPQSYVFNPDNTYGPVPYDVGDNVGPDGTDMVEFFVSRADLGNPMGVMSVTYHASQNENPDSDYAAAFKFHLGGIPALSAWGTAALVLLFGLAALWMLRGRRPALTGVLLITLLVAGVAWAATITMDGLAGDWAGVPVAVTDPPDDSSTLPSDSNEDNVSILHGDK